MIITGIASCVSTLAILFLAQTFGARLTTWRGAYKHAGLAKALDTSRNKVAWMRFMVEAGWLHV
jgi:hypothetical protein